MTALSVRNLTKRYPAFTLDRVSFTLEEGRVLGLIGANGAGKSTTIKGIMGLIRTEGETEIFGENAHSDKAKSLVGYAGGGFRFYPHKKVKTLGGVVARFYPDWREDAFCRRLNGFGIDPEKKISALSEGMKVKLSLALALSRGARLLILDEPTSGLDPVSREELCDMLETLVLEERVAILFSTHITSDLARLADNIVLLSNGKIAVNESLDGLMNKYFLAEFPSREAARGIGVKRNGAAYCALVPRDCSAQGVQIREPTLDKIIVHLEYERRIKA